MDEYRNGFQQSTINMAFDCIQQINKELQKNNIININNFLLNLSVVLSKDSSISKDKLSDIVIDVANNMLIKCSNTFKEINENEKFLNVHLFINEYMKKTLKYYDSLIMTNQNKFDRYVEMIEKTPKKEIKISENLYMTTEDIQNTMHLLNEAVRNYYEIYHKKSLFATFTDDQIIQFKIKESELAHLLGVKLKKIANNPQYADLFHITQQEIECLNDYTLDPNGNAAIEVLHKIVDMSNGNLLQFEEDRLRKLEHYEYKTADYSDPDEALSFYSKINMRSKAFIEFKPLEELSLVLNFPEGYKIIKTSEKEDSQHSLLISKNGLSKLYKYSTLIANYNKNEDRRYFESLFLKKPEELEEFQKLAIPAISTRVVIADDNYGGSGGSGGIEKVFSVSEQKKFLEEIQSDFKKLNLENIAEYFENLNNECKKSNKKS